MAQPDPQASASVATLGMFILDSFEYTADYSCTRKPQLRSGEWYIGGGGTYATIGARMWLPPDRITMIIHKGHDFPPKIVEELKSYASEGLFSFVSDIEHPKTTRALNTYSNDRRDFAYLTPKRRVRLSELYSTRSSSCGSGRAADFVHVICSPARLRELLKERQEHFPQWEPQWVWEPVPESCKAENLQTLIGLAADISVFSPNELEASELLGHPHPPQSQSDIEAIADHFYQAGFRAVVIRSGRRGAFVVGSFGAQPVLRCWVPALIENQDQVIDQTGAGNAFLGGLMAGLASGKGLLEAACYGAVSSGLTITQLGLPKLTLKNEAEPALEAWNDGLHPHQLFNQLRMKVQLV